MTTVATLAADVVVLCNCPGDPKACAGCVARLIHHYEDQLAALRELEDAARAISTEMLAAVSDHCGLAARASGRFCEDYGCANVEEWANPLLGCLTRLDSLRGGKEGSRG